MKKTTVLTTVSALLLSVTLLVIPVYLQYPTVKSESVEDLEKLVRTELSEYIFVYCWPGINPHAEFVAVERSFYHDATYNFNFTCSLLEPLERFVSNLATKPDPHAYIKQLKEKLDNPPPPNMTSVDEGTVTYEDVEIVPGKARVYSWEFATTTKFSFATSVGLLSGDEACYTILDLRAIKSGSVDHRVWERVLHFENTEGIPGNALSLMGVGEKFEIIVGNDDSYSQEYRIYRSYQVIQ